MMMLMMVVVGWCETRGRPLFRMARDDITRDKTTPDSPPLG